MRLTSLMIVLFSGAIGSVTTAEVSSATSQKALANRIVGGTPAIAAEFPFIVSLQRGSTHFCEGSLVDKSWVLTAAHCVRSGTSGLKIRIGLLKQGDQSGTETFSANKIIIHPDNSGSINDYDFALIQLKGESRFTPVGLSAAPIDIPDEEEKAAMAITAGWGTTSEGGISSTLLKVDVPLVSTRKCEVAYSGQITKSMICAG